MSKKVRKPFTHRAGIKALAVILAALCLFTAYFTASLCIICLHNDVYFDNGEKLLRDAVYNQAYVNLRGTLIGLSGQYVGLDEDGITDRKLLDERAESFLGNNAYVSLKDSSGKEIYSYGRKPDDASTLIIDNYALEFTGIDPNSSENFVKRFGRDFASAAEWLSYEAEARNFSGVLLLAYTVAFPDDTVRSGTLSLVQKNYGGNGEERVNGLIFNALQNLGTTYLDAADAASNIAVPDIGGPLTESEDGGTDAREYYNLSPTDCWNPEVWNGDYMPGVMYDYDLWQIRSDIGNSEFNSLIPELFLDYDSVVSIDVRAVGTACAAASVDADADMYLLKSADDLDTKFIDAITARTVIKYADNYPAVLIISGLLFTVLIIYLCCAAGRRAGADAPSPIWFDKIPFELFAAGAGVGLWWLGEEYASLVYSGYIVKMLSKRIFDIAMFLLLPAGFSVFAVLAVMTLATRLKCGVFWKYTAVGMIFRAAIALCRLIGKLFGYVFVGWKAVLLIVLISAYDLLCVSLFQFDMAPLFAAVVIGNIVILCVMLVWVGGFNRIRKYAKNLSNGELDSHISRDSLVGDLKKCADDLENVGEGVKKAVDERMRSERLKTELITNVSHDLKTPLTSIVNYVDILSKDDDPAEAKEHIDILRRQAAKMKKLIEDLVEVSKATSGNIPVNLSRTDVNLLISQTAAEYAARFEEHKLETVIRVPNKKLIANLDGRLMWRVFDNLCGNICKYSLPNTRVYITAEQNGPWITLSFRNISSCELKMSGDELVERFVRGDSSRNTEGSGLGLSIAKSLCDLQGVGFAINIDGDLFKVSLTIPKANDEDIMEGDFSSDDGYGDGPFGSEEYEPEVREESEAAEPAVSEEEIIDEHDSADAADEAQPEA